MAPNTPTTAAQASGAPTTAAQIQQLLEQTNARITQLERENSRLQAATNTTAKAKLEAPPKFGGSKDELTGWLVQMRAYILYYEERFVNEAQKVGYAASRLEGKALRWFEPTLNDYLENLDDDDREDFTQQVFQRYAKFEKEIRKVFGDTDEKLHAQERLAQLRQTKSTAAYATQFRQDSLRAAINEEGLMQLFYDGLREEVKDELYKADRPDTLDEYIAMAIRIDDRQYARKQQKRGGIHAQVQYKSNDKKRRHHRSTSHGTHSGPMDVDAAQRLGQHQKKTRFDITCFNCGKKGHVRKDCRSPKKEGWRPVHGKETATVDACVIEVAAASYMQEDLEDDIDKALHEESLVDTDDSEPSDDQELATTTNDLEQFIRQGTRHAARGAVAEAVLQRGFALTQEEDGTWRTRRTNDEPTGANPVYLQSQVDELRETVAELRSDKAGLMQQLEFIKAKVKRLADEKREWDQGKREVLWDGPSENEDTLGDDQPNTVRNPEWEYHRDQETRRLKGQDDDEWDDYWAKRRHVSIGDATMRVENEGYGKRFEYLEEDAARLHPSRHDHQQVPWFQCIAHECRYHFRSKVDYNHWPTRPVDKNGQPKSITWVWDHGYGPDSLLWHIEGTWEEPYGVIATPKRAWPTACQQFEDHDFCSTKDCMIHMDRKLCTAHEAGVWTDTSVRQRLRSSRRHRLQTHESRQQEELQGLAAQDAEQGVQERDAFQDAHKELGNGSGPSEGPGQH